MFNRLVAQRLRASSSLDNRGDPHYRYVETRPGIYPGQLDSHGAIAGLGRMVSQLSGVPDVGDTLGAHNDRSSNRLV